MNAWLLSAAALFCIIFPADFHSIRNSNSRARTQGNTSSDSVKFSPLCASCTAAMSALR
ncbi:hypothetical protein ANCCAN_26033 [Ancylostoma caninum]|uniref:Uncharacterized protein n=1 Tax=Ancylostoma caninum TaxID=29170 RepID=A0A368F7Y2_ANCCA|nr:hypothetical protein ANCCAN_26033 [Ancylostoma caninum]